MNRAKLILSFYGCPGCIICQEKLCNLDERWPIKRSLHPIRTSFFLLPDLKLGHLELTKN